MPRVIHTFNGLRVCTKCKQPKESNLFYKTDRTTDGCQSRCIQCHKEYFKNKPKKEKKTERILLTPEEKRQRRREYQKRKKEQMTPDKLAELRIKEKIRRDSRKEEAKLYKQKYQIQNKERLNNISRMYAKTHKQERRDYLKKYAPRRRELSKKRREEDPLYKFKENLRAGVYRAFQSKGWGKTGKSFEILGCDFETAKNHIERQFTKGMSWDKVGSEIHIDHKIPISLAKTKEEVRHLCHYRNLQPLWKIDNLVKNSMIPQVQIHLPI